MPQKHRIISSSTGTNAKGGHIITPDSVLSYVINDDPTVYKSLVSDTTRFLFNSTWTHSMKNVNLPIQRLFDHVPIAPPLIRQWLKSTDGKMGGLLLPGFYTDVDSKDPRIHIVKQGQSSATTIQADVILHIFRRELDPSPELQPFDPAVWNPDAYEAWEYMHTEFAPMFEEECDAKNSPKLPHNICTLFRRVMRTHFADCGLIYSEKIWLEFGLQEMVNNTRFMQKMLAELFWTYIVAPEPPSLPPLFNAVTVGSDQRICAKCLSFRLGSGQMMRCPCHQVYYCSKACQNADWKVHRVVCGKRE
jgi:hypothetical protein